MLKDFSPTGFLVRAAHVVGLGIVLTSACDSTAGDSDAADSEASETDPSGSGDDEARITVRVDDGTVYELEARSCETSFTDPSRFPLSNGYILSGVTEDGATELFVSRAGLDDDSVVFSGAVEGDFDENGNNSKMVYSFDSATPTLTIDEATVAGTVGSRAIGPTRPHGDNPVFTIEADCG